MSFCDREFFASLKAVLVESTLVKFLPLKVMKDSHRLREIGEMAKPLLSAILVV